MEHELVIILKEYLSEIVKELQPKTSIFDYLNFIIPIMAIGVALFIGLSPGRKEKKKKNKLANFLRMKILYDINRLPTQIYYKGYKEQGEKIEYVNDSNREFFLKILETLEKFSIDIELLDIIEGISLMSIIFSLRKGFDLGGYLELEYYDALLRDIVKLHDYINLKLYGKNEAKKPEYEINIYDKTSTGASLHISNPYKETVITNEKHTAYHESGHCLCYVFDDKAILYTEIVKEDEGHTKGELKGTRSYFNNEFKDEEDQHIFGPASQKLLIMLISGCLSELIYKKKKISYENLMKCLKGIRTGDGKRILELDLQDHIKEVIEEAEKRLRENWSAVKELAKKLLKKKRIENEEYIKSIIIK